MTASTSLNIISAMRLVPAFAFLVVVSCSPAGPEPADLLLVNGYVYTVDAQRSVAEAVAIRDGAIVFVGSTAEAKGFAGPGTRTLDLGGKMLLPGLHDVHIHLLDMVDKSSCDLDSQLLSLEEIASILKDCLRRDAIPEGEWLQVSQWLSYNGNQPSARLPSLRAALDSVSRTHPIILWGDDGHHAAVNSAALARARDPGGHRVGLDRGTLDGPFAPYRGLVAVDANGEPSGGVAEDAQHLFDTPVESEVERAKRLVDKIGPALAREGITSVQDAKLDPAVLPVFADLESRGVLSYRLQTALYLDPDEYRRGDGHVDVVAMVAELESARRAMAGSRLIAATAAKIFADGGMEGDPYAVPPTLGNAAMLEAYRQPRFAIDDDGVLELIGQVDLSSALCEQVRAGAISSDPASTAAFMETHGFHPAQCTISHGVLSDEEEVIRAYVRALIDADFIVHVHVIGDRATRVVLDAFEAALPPGQPLSRPHTLAHAMLVHPDDQRRIGRMGLFVAFTYAWAAPFYGYEMTVVPFVTDIDSSSELYDQDTYYMRNIYPARTLKDLGAVLVAGSDAPVDERSPRPFINMLGAVTRGSPMGPPIGAAQAIDIHEVLEAYTINGARAMQQDDRVGSIEVGKRADLVLVDRNLVELYEREDWDSFADTSALMTIFDGEIVYDRR